MSNAEEENFIEAGDMRPSQLITTHGPGAIINMKNDAVMLYGCHLWPQKESTKKYKILHHELLQKKLSKIGTYKITSFRMPLSQDNSRNLPCFSFPRWGVCKNCDLLQYHESIPKTDKGFFCWKCEKNDVKLDDCELSHARFVVICPKGHIDEFPWEEWVHRDNPDRKCKKNPGKNIKQIKIIPM